MRHAAACLAALSLAGCTAMPGDGSGPLVLSPQVKAAYDHYLSLQGPQAFAVSTDGTAWGATYCRWGTCRGNDVSIALENCRKSGKTCFIYDREGRVVWHGAEQPAPRLAAATPSATPVAAVAASRPAAATALPTVARGVLAAAVDYEQPPAGVTADPVVQQLDGQCRAAGSQHCGEHQVPKDRRQVFVRGVDPQVHALFSQTGLAPGATYESLCRLVDPSNGIVATVRGVVTVPADAEHAIARNFNCHFALDSAAPLGRWAVALVVNGTPMSVLRFDVVDRSGAHAPAPARGLRQEV